MKQDENNIYDLIVRLGQVQHNLRIAEDNKASWERKVLHVKSEAATLRKYIAEVRKKQKMERA